MMGPCKGCTKRAINCHANCKDYTDWKVQWDERQAEGRAERRLRRQLSGSTVYRPVNLRKRDKHGK